MATRSTNAASPGSTASAILDVAERITQAVGYNGLSFRDVAAAIGIKTASIHYHFPSKALLGAALVRRYTDRIAGHLQGLDTGAGHAHAALDVYVDVFRRTLEEDGRMCLAGMLAAERDAIPPEVLVEVRRFVDVNVRWLAALLAAIDGAPAVRAAHTAHGKALFAALEGAMLIARGTDDPASFVAMATQFGRLGLLPRRSASLPGTAGPARARRPR